MKRIKWDFVFLAMSLSILFYFSAASITGNVVQSMHCTDDGCKPLCRSIADCPDSQVCCMENNVGVCQLVCKNKYELMPSVTVPNVESPMVVSAKESGTMIVILASVFFLFIFYDKAKRSKLRA